MQLRFVVLALALLALPLDAAPKHKAAAGKVGKGFWKVLVTPKAEWVLHRTDDLDITASVTVETYDVRKVGAADVARLRWTFRSIDHNVTRDISGEYGKFTQVAVTPAGLYLLDKDDDDAKIAKALEGKPARSDPPKAYSPTKLNQGRFLSIEGGKVCMGVGQVPGAGDCTTTCGGICMTSAGITEAFGAFVPDQGVYSSTPTEDP